MLAALPSTAGDAGRAERLKLVEDAFGYPIRLWAGLGSWSFAEPSKIGEGRGAK